MNKGVGSHAEGAINCINKVSLTWLEIGEEEEKLTASSVTSNDIMALVEIVHICTDM
jgi:hypothetical protein